MSLGKLKSRTFRRVFRVAPGGRNVVHHIKRKPSKAHCGSCRAELKAVPRETPYKMQNMPKTMKRPERPYGGVLCTKCMREKIKGSSRSKEK